MIIKIIVVFFTLIASSCCFSEDDFENDTHSSGDLLKLVGKPNHQISIDIMNKDSFGFKSVHENGFQYGITIG